MFTDEDMMQSQVIREKFFNEYDMLGWAVLEGGSTVEQFVLYESGRSAFIGGYYIFYDKNEGMQSYLVNWNAFSKQGNTEYANERAVRQFRTIYRNRKEEKNERHIIGLLYMTTLMLLIFCCVMGISMINNYEKMKGMEAALNHLAFAMEEQKLPDVMWQSGAQEKEVISSSVVTEGNPELVEQAISENIVEPTLENEMESVSQNEADKLVEKKTNTLQAANEGEITHAVYIVQKGDTLLQISKRFYNRLDMVDEICNLNGIENPNDIMQQQKILLP